MQSLHSSQDTPRIVLGSVISVDQLSNVLQKSLWIEVYLTEGVHPSDLVLEKLIDWWQKLVPLPMDHPVTEHELL